MQLDASLELRERVFENRTYGLSDGRIEGFVDGLDALKQAIYKVLSTERFDCPIYSFGYGIAWRELIGEERPYVRAEARRMIREALERDDRIREVDGFRFDFSGDFCHCAFNVSSIYGEIEIETEVATG